MVRRERMPEAKEIALAVLGGSVALASLLVVFIGFLIAHAEALPASTPDRLLRRFKATARWGLLPVGGMVIVALLSYLWMFTGCTLLYRLWAGGFFVVLVGFVAYAIISVLMIR